MKFWFTKARISAALDTGKPPSSWLRRRTSKSEELRGFEQDMLALDRALRQSVPKPEVPASLHRSIMQAVQAASQPGLVQQPGEFATPNRMEELTACSPSPQPSPLGRGRIVARASANGALQISSADGARGSLSPRERAGVRGKTISDRLRLTKYRAFVFGTLGWRGPSLLRWATVPALAAIALLGVWWALHTPVRPSAPDTPSLAAATSAFELSGQLARTVPAAVVAPLSGELERLNLDLANTAQFLLASLP